MSEIRVTNVTGENGNSPVNFTKGINMSGIVTATAFIPSQGQLSHRNTIINGAHAVAQRGSAAVTVTTSAGYRCVDRFKSDIDGSGGGDWSHAQSTDVPAGQGFRNSSKITTVTQASQPTSTGNRHQLYYQSEKQDVTHLEWGTSAAKTCTLSFWVKSSVAQNFFGFLQTDDGTSQSFPFQTGSLTANTWTKVTVKVSGNSNIQIDNDEELGLNIFWDLFEGTNLTDSGVTLNQWGAFSATAKTPDQTSTWYTTDDATFELTGVQLEVGDTATNFEHLKIGDSLRQCQRYCFRDGTDKFHYSALGSIEHYEFPVQMRANPTVTLEASPTGASVNRARPCWVTITGMGSNSGNIRVKAEAEV